MSQSGDSEPDAASQASTLEYQQEAFETFRVKIIQLCIDIGFGTPSEVERITGGSFNRIIGVTFSSPVGNPQTTRYVIRIPRFTLNSTEVRNIKDQVAVLRICQPRRCLHMIVQQTMQLSLNSWLKSDYQVNQLQTCMTLCHWKSDCSSQLQFQTLFKTSNLSFFRNLADWFKAQVYQCLKSATTSRNFPVARLAYRVIAWIALVIFLPLMKRIYPHSSNTVQISRPRGRD